jgi:type III secretory pathway component EscV
MTRLSRSALVIAVLATVLAVMAALLVGLPLSIVLAIALALLLALLGVGLLSEAKDSQRAEPQRAQSQERIPPGRSRRQLPRELVDPFAHDTSLLCVLRRHQFLTIGAPPIG